MKQMIGWTTVLFFFVPALAQAECNDGGQIKMSGTVSRIFANESKGWTLIVGGLNSDFVVCVPSDISGQKAPSGPWYPLAVRKKPSPDCKAGSQIDATITVSDGLMGNTAKVAQWTCR